MEGAEASAFSAPSALPRSDLTRKEKEDTIRTVNTIEE